MTTYNFKNQIFMSGGAPQAHAELCASVVSVVRGENHHRDTEFTKAHRELRLFRARLVRSRLVDKKEFEFTTNNRLSLAGPV